MLPSQDYPIFDLVVPSTGKRVKFRQFTVREEKLLIQAQESDDLNVIANAVTGVIAKCVTGIDNVDELALFDIEYIMTRIRAKSAGEDIDLNLPCDIDSKHKRAPLRVNLEKIEVKIPEGHSKKIALFGTTGIVMRYPTMRDLHNFETMSGIEAAALCVDYIYNDDEVFYAKEQTPLEIAEFLSDLTEIQFDKIEQLFFKTMPVFQLDIEYACPDCGHRHKKMIKGLANFFA